MPHIASAAQVVADGPSQRLAALHDMVMEPNGRFSASAALSELDAIERAVPPDSVDRGRVEQLKAIIVGKIDRPAEAIDHAAEALRIDAAHPFLSPSERARTNYALARHAEDLGDCRRAIPAYQAATAGMDAADDFTESQRLGVRERLGYCLHEAGRFAEARALNEIVLARGAALFGQDSPKLMVVLTNLAQNCHELHDMAAARSFLDRWLAIATHAGATEQVELALFQEGVLAFEAGAADEARAFMQKRVLVATQSGDARRIRSAREDLDILEQKLRE